MFTTQIVEAVPLADLVPVWFIDCKMSIPHQQQDREPTISLFFACADYGYSFAGLSNQKEEFK